MKYIILPLLIISVSLKAQTIRDTTIYFGTNGKITTKSEAKAYTQLLKKSNSIYLLRYANKKDNQWNESNFDEVMVKNDTLQIIDSYFNNRLTSNQTRYIKKISDTLFYFKEVFKTGEVLCEGYTNTFIPIIKMGNYKTYHIQNGKLHTDRIYKNNELISNILFNIKGDTICKNAFYDADILPEYHGGDLNEFRNDVIRATRYPEKAREGGIQGKVIVEFVVLEDGLLVYPTIIKSVEESIDKEAIRVVISLNDKWKPGSTNGKPVKVIYTLPIVFKLQNH